MYKVILAGALVGFLCGCTCQIGYVKGDLGGNRMTAFNAQDTSGSTNEVKAVRNPVKRP
jgi:hypothetical protein